MGETGKKSDLICVPGQRLCLSDENTVSGEGTYERHGYIYSLLAGVVNISPKDKVSSDCKPSKQPFIMCDLDLFDLEFSQK